MKVLVSSLSRDYGGVESLFLGLAHYVNEKGLQMDFVCTDSSAAREKDFIAYGSKVHHIERPSKKLGKYIKAFKEIFLTEKYDIYHVNLTRYRFPLDILIAKKCGAKIILHCHATKIYDVGSLKVRIIRRIEQALFKPITLASSKLNLACSENAGKYLFRPMPFKVLHNGIDLNRFQFDEKKRNDIRKELGLEGKKVIGHIGRFSQEKNQSFLFQILNALLTKDSEFRLLCVGNGDLLDEKKEEAKRMGLADAIVFTGERNDISNLLSAMDVFVFPSIHEALPITLIEAQANGLPCLVSDCVTKEIDVINAIYRLSLKDSPEIWAQEVETIYGQREVINDTLRFADFEIENMTVRLNEIYEIIAK